MMELTKGDKKTLEKLKKELYSLFPEIKKHNFDWMHRKASSYNFLEYYFIPFGRDIKVFNGNAGLHVYKTSKELSYRLVKEVFTSGEGTKEGEIIKLEQQDLSPATYDSEKIINLLKLLKDF